MAEINTADIEKSNKLLETQKELILKVSSAMGALKGMCNDSMKAQRSGKPEESHRAANEGAGETEGRGGEEQGKAGGMGRKG